MSDLIKSFITEFNTNPTFEAQKKLESLYVEHYKERPIFQKEIIELVKSGAKVKTEWNVFFHFDSPFWKEIYLAEQERKAVENMELCNREPKLTVLVEMAADMAFMTARNIQEEVGEEMGENIANIWKAVFKDSPVFEKTWAANEERTANIYKEIVKHSENKVMPHTVNTLEVIVPFVVTNKGNEQVSSEVFNELRETSEYAEFMNIRVDYFNGFGLSSYMDIDACHNVTLKTESDKNIFTLSLSQEETDLTELKKNLSGQLSSGLGDSLSQRALLIKDEIYYFGFDYKNMGDFYKVQVPKRKMKM